MKRFFLFTGLLTGCMPTAVAPQPRLLAETKVEGGLLHFTVTNTGPTDLLLENGCPRPFLVRLAGLPSGGNTMQGCLTIALPPEPWPIGEKKMGIIQLLMPGGTYTLNSWADVRIKLAPGGVPQGVYRSIRVHAPPFTTTWP